MGAQGHTSSLLAVQERSLPCPHGPCWVRTPAQPGKTLSDPSVCGEWKMAEAVGWVGRRWRARGCPTPSPAPDAAGPDAGDPPPVSRAHPPQMCCPACEEVVARGPALAIRRAGLRGPSCPAPHSVSAQTHVGLWSRSSQLWHTYTYAGTYMFVPSECIKRDCNCSPSALLSPTGVYFPLRLYLLPRLCNSLQLGSAVTAKY